MKEYKSFNTFNIKIKPWYGTILTYLSEILDIHRQRYTDHVRINTQIKNAELTEDQIKIWKAFLPSKWRINSKDKYGANLNESINKKIKNYRRSGAFDYFEVWSDNITETGDLLVVGVCQGRYFQIGIQNTEGGPYKTIEDVKKKLSTDIKLKVNEYTRYWSVILFTMFCFILTSAYWLKYLANETCKYPSFSNCAPVALSSFIFILFFMMFIIAKLEYDHWHEERKNILELCTLPPPS